MPAYRINIDGRIYEGHYGNKADAVFGALRKDHIDRARSAQSLWPTKDDHMQFCATVTESEKGHLVRCNCGAMEAWKDARQTLDAPSLIGVEPITDRKISKKIHRVDE